MLKTLALAGAACAMILFTPAPSHAAAWCAYQGGPNQYENCGYYTYNQCRAAVRGVGGDCRPNPYAERDRDVPGAMDDDDNTGFITRDDWDDDDE